MSGFNRFNFIGSESELDYVGELAKYMCEHFETKIGDFEFKHKFTRRFNILFSVLATFGFIFVLSSIESLSATRMSDVGEILILDESYYPSVIAAFLFFSFFFFLVVHLIAPKGSQTKSKGLMLLSNLFYLLIGLSMSSLTVFEWEEVLPIFFVLGIVGLVFSYAINSKLGYTKAWSRNRLARQKVQVIYGQYIGGYMHEEIAVEQLFQVFEKSKEQAHIDIVKDYENYGSAAFGWIKGLRK
ncbi:hypothetical protein [Pseudoalteromonas sp. MMG024]|uniref:hypothetical protein n=1 Tax=Pseudoalteromonas sp. MMG024 TaxID=2909980 RepID=UPI001F361E45|nr:hypothetical protein [Pseudoalteromonas sp. MMG024]MCF6456317.1 hypothetical protein [Pseudoalteromonas sp. MMG024]